MALRCAGVLADIHAGSTAALMPPGFTTGNGNPIVQSPIQAWLWDCWLKSEAWLDDVFGDDPHALVVNGDVIEGLHHRSKQVWSADASDHAACGIEILKHRARRASRRFIVEGTECHTGTSEAAIGAALDAETNPETGQHVFPRLTLDICGVRVVVRHHCSATTRSWLESGEFSRVIDSEQLEAAKNNEPIPRVICCAHRHRYGCYQNGRDMCIISPPWQMLTRFGHKVVSAARTRPGSYVLDWRGIPDGKLPKVHELLFDTPPPAAVSL